MSESLFSPLWYRVADIKPQLRQHIEMHRHDYRGLIWYILEDKASGRSHRFNATAYQVIGLLDGQISINKIWDLLNDRMGDSAPSQDDIIQLLGQLHAADLLHSAHSPDVEELLTRRQQFKSNKLKQRYSNPLTIKIPLWDPDRFLQRHVSKVSWLFHWSIGLVWLMLIGLATLVSIIHWPEISNNFIDNNLSPYNLAIMVLLYPIIKFLHELGHAFSAKHHGGDVHEMGITFLIFMPIPYVDVSSINFIRNKHQRILVSAAGILVELFLAAMGLFLWLSAEPGLIKDIAFNMMVIGGISSLLFNGNPLLKYDGYYILADLLEIPNLFQRSTKYLIYLCQKYLFGLSDIPSPASASGEASWFVIYSLSSFIYRMGLLWIITLYIIDTFFILGVLLAFWMLTQQIILPLIKGLIFVFSSPSVHRHRRRAISSLSVISALLFITLITPMPAYTISEGVVWMPDDAQLRAETSGIAGPVLLNTSTNIKQNSTVIEIEDLSLNTEVIVLLAKLKELNTQFRAELDDNYIKAEEIKEKMFVVAEELKYAQKKQRAMTIKSRKAGTLLIPNAADLPGKFIQQGDIIGYVIDDSPPIIRVVIKQTDIGQIQKQVDKVMIRLINQPDRLFSATIKRQMPEATNTLPSAALSTINGGQIQTDSNDSEQLTTQEKIFHIDLEYSPLITSPEIGQRVYVRFEHPFEPLATQWYRSIRQVFLRQFNV